MRDNNDDRIPCVADHRGIGLHDSQSEKRLALVKRELDSVLDLSDVHKLIAICGNVAWSPEARLTAGAKLRAMHELATEDRKTRPLFDLAFVVACTAGLDSRYWRSPWVFGSLLDPGRMPGGDSPVSRDVPLADDERGAR
jgi:hypothetical protein